MIITQILDGTNLIRRYSDIGKMLLQNETGIIYGEAVDIANAPYTYTEVSVPENPDTEEISEDEFLSIILGDEIEDDA
jgi:hypothetical protein